MGPAALALKQGYNKRERVILQSLARYGHGRKGVVEAFPCHLDRWWVDGRGWLLTGGGEVGADEKRWSEMGKGGMMCLISIWERKSRLSRERKPFSFSSFFCYEFEFKISKVRSWDIPTLIVVGKVCYWALQRCTYIKSAKSCNLELLIRICTHIRCIHNYVGHLHQQ